ncbi:MAG: aldo/keto reductase [Chloroflexota bacterium]
MDPFERVSIGRTGLAVTRLGLGGAPIGGQDMGGGLYPGATYEDAVATIRRGYELGITHFDTAPLYGQGRSEVRFGAVLSNVPRDSFVLSTKVGRVLDRDTENPGTHQPEGIPHLNPVFDLSRDGILRSLEESLKRLNLDRVDILYLHDPDVEPGLENKASATAFPTMLELREQGTVKAIGTGMNQWQMPARFIREFELDIVLLAGRYTLLDHDAYEEFLPLCVERGVKLSIGGPYNSGILAGDPRRPTTFNYEQAPKEWVEKASAIKDVCDRHNVDLRAAALQFPLAHPAVATVIPGARTPREVEENAELLRTSIPARLWEDLRNEGLIPKDAPTF